MFKLVPPPVLLVGSSRDEVCHNDDVKHSSLEIVVSTGSVASKGKGYEGALGEDSGSIMMH